MKPPASADTAIDIVMPPNTTPKPAAQLRQPCQQTSATASTDQKASLRRDNNTLLKIWRWIREKLHQLIRFFMPHASSNNISNPIVTSQQNQLSHTDTVKVKVKTKKDPQPSQCNGSKSIIKP